MKKTIYAIGVLLLSVMMTSCSENYSNGEKTGLVTKMQRQGVMWKSWEGHLNLTQTGMNSTTNAPWDFSLDDDNLDQNVLNTLDSAADKGWLVRLTYHETFLMNWFENRGHTNDFVTKVTVVNKNIVQNNINGNGRTNSDSGFRQGHVIDTIYVVIDRSK